jgi:hypothetical protein
MGTVLDKLRVAHLVKILSRPRGTRRFTGMFTAMFTGKDVQHFGSHTDTGQSAMHRNVDSYNMQHDNSAISTHTHVNVLIICISYEKENS